MANINIKRYNGSSWEIHYPKTTIGQVINLSSQLANMQSDIDGKAAKSYVDAKIHLKSNTDNRGVATVPNDYNSKFEIKGLKSNSAIGITGGGTYSALLGIRGWSDSSGGEAHELAFDSSGRIGHRYGSTTAWNAWKLLVESDDPRLTNARPPTAHQHSATDIIGGRFSLDRLPTGIAGAVLKGNNTSSPVWGSISWGEVQSKPSWIGASKPTYTASDVGALAATHPAKDVTALDMGRWSNAFNWGDHATQGYLKEASLSTILVGGVSTIVSSNLNTNRALISNGSGKVAVSAVTSTELGYLDGVTSNVQTQLNGKAASSHGHNWTEITNKPALLRQVSFTGGTLIVEML